MDNYLSNLSNIIELNIPEAERLLEAAKAALENAYSPYSSIRVAAAVLTGSGQIYAGCNIENSSYSLTICAERSCLFHALVHGERDFIAMAIVTDSEQVTSPCGACRQVLAEFAPQLPIIFANPQGDRLFSVDQLLPAQFTLQK